GVRGSAGAFHGEAEGRGATDAGEWRSSGGRLMVGEGSAVADLTDSWARTRKLTLAKPRSPSKRF
ncbi:MAG: hypothetical protein WEB53_09200, partial [Akkermansiaceae bacterium]